MGDKYETAMVEGCKHLRKPKIIETIKELKKERLAQSLLTTEGYSSKLYRYRFC